MNPTSPIDIFKHGQWRYKIKIEYNNPLVKKIEK